MCRGWGQRDPEEKKAHNNNRHKYGLVPIIHREYWRYSHDGNTLIRILQNYFATSAINNAAAGLCAADPRKAL